MTSNLREAIGRQPEPRVSGFNARSSPRKLYQNFTVFYRFLPFVPNQAKSDGQVSPAHTPKLYQNFTVFLFLLLGSIPKHSEKLGRTITGCNPSPPKATKSHPISNSQHRYLIVRVNSALRRANLDRFRHASSHAGKAATLRCVRMPRPVETCAHSITEGTETQKEDGRVVRG